MLEKLGIAATIGAGLTIGLMWPSRSATSGSAVPELVIAKSSDGHFYADAKVNGRPVRFMIDTGASETALTEDDARELGIAVHPEDYQMIGEGASGMVRGQFVKVDSIDLNGISQAGAKVAVVPGATVSLLGQSFLANVDEIVIRKHEMRLRAGID